MRGLITVEQMILVGIGVVLFLFALVLVWRIALIAIEGACWSNARAVVDDMASLLRELQVGGEPAKTTVVLGRCVDSILIFNKGHFFGQGAPSGELLEIRRLLAAHCTIERERHILAIPFFERQGLLGTLWQDPGHAVSILGEYANQKVRSIDPYCITPAGTDRSFTNLPLSLEGPGAKGEATYCLTLARPSQNQYTVSAEVGSCST